MILCFFCFFCCFFFFKRNTVDELRIGVWSSDVCSSDQRPDLALSSGFITGFPGESDRDFEATLQLVRDVGFASAYAFRYSARPGTPGSLMPNQVPEAVAAERLQALQALLPDPSTAFNQTIDRKSAV